MLNKDNLYAEMDKKTKRNFTIQQEVLDRQRRKKRLLSLSSETLKLLFLFFICVIGFVLKHDGDFIQSTKDYFENFSNPSYSRKPSRHDVIMEKEESQTLVPVLEIKGKITRDGEEFITFSHEGVSYTKSAGEVFANKYQITEIGEQEIEVTDGLGNYFYYQCPPLK